MSWLQSGGCKKFVNMAINYIIYGVEPPPGFGVKKMCDSKRWVSASFGLAPVLLAAQMALASEVTIPPIKDNTLFQHDEGTLSSGAGSYLFVGNSDNGASRRALITFDIAAHIPEGATINRVKLILNMSGSSERTADVTLHRILADWGEGTSAPSGQEEGGSTATEGDATWIHTFFSTRTWDVPGGDFAELPSSSREVGGPGSYFWTGSEMAADVQVWLDHPASNFGWMMLGVEGSDPSAKRFDSRENGEEVNRPVLEVHFDLTAVEARSWGQVKLEGR